MEQGTQGNQQIEVGDPGLSDGDADTTAVGSCMAPPFNVVQFNAKPTPSLP